MTTPRPRYTKEEHARRGMAFYERLRPRLEAENRDKIVAIDIDSGAYEIDDEIIPAADRLFVCFPEAQIWFMRVGHRGVHRFGMGATSRAS